MVVNVGGYRRGGGQPRWFMRSSWHQGPGGHVHVVPPHRSGQPAAPAASQPAAGNEPGELARQPRQDIVKALQSLIQQVSGLQSDNDRLRVDNDRLSTEIERIRALMREAGGEIARRASQLLADTEDQRPPTSEPSSLKLHFMPPALHPGADRRSAAALRRHPRTGDDVKSVPASRHRRSCSARTVQPEPGGSLSRRVMRGRTCRRALMVGASRSVRPWPGHAIMPAGVPVDAHQALPATVTLDCPSARSSPSVATLARVGRFQEHRIRR